MNLKVFSYLTVTIWACILTVANAQVKVGDTFQNWSTGFLDIHHISTGKGECMFAIMPDGTTMMIDAGETGTDKRNFKPDGSRSSGEWISRYIQRMMSPLSEKNWIICS